MSKNAPESAGNIVKFQISSNFTDYAVELSAGVVVQISLDEKK